MNKTRREDPRHGLIESLMAVPLLDPWSRAFSNQALVAIELAPD